MGANVQEVTKRNYSDSSGKFYEGMTKKEAEGKYSLFYLMDQEKEFNRIDQDGDGILSKSEITEELYSDIESTKKSVKFNAGLGLAAGLLGWAIHNKVPKKTALFNLGVVLYSIGVTIYQKMHAESLEKRIIQGYN